MAEISSLSSFKLPSVEELVNRYSAKNTKSVTDLQGKKTKLNQKSAVLTDLKSNLKTLRTRLKGFTDVGTEAKLNTKTAVSSDETIFTVKADATASKGVNTISVSRIARNDLAVSGSFLKSSTDLADELAGSQSFSVQIGSNSAQTVSLTVAEGESNLTVLRNIASAINTNVEDVNAAVVSSGRYTARLSIVSDEAGSENVVTLTALNDSMILKELGFFSGASTTRRAFTASDGGFLVTDTDDLDANVTVNGIEITSSTNTLTEVLQGVTITLRKAQDVGSTAETFTIAQATDEIKDQVEAFIKEYNSTLNYITAKTRVNTTDGTRGTLAGDFTYTKLRLDIRTIVSTPVSGVKSGNPELLTKIGIKINTDGTLTLDDEEALEDTIQEDSDAVTDLFTGTNGLSNQLNTVIEKFTNAGGTIDKTVTTVKNQTETVTKQISRNEGRTKIQENALRQKFTQLERALTLLNSQQALLQRYGFSSNTPSQYPFSNYSSQTGFFI
ncbi:flagellar filament capping protein FliD [candidate division KSB1 bacterium]